MTKIIAELGINHNGDLEILKRMALAAHEAGADYVKLQKRFIPWCYSEGDLRRPCDSPWGSTVRDKVEGRELDYEQIAVFSGFCADHGIHWGVSCFDIRSLAEMERFFGKDIAFFKVPSALGLLSRKRYLCKLADYRKQTIISVGLCPSDDEILAVATLFDEVGCPFVMNHCVPLYPCPPHRLNLRRIRTLTGIFAASKWCLGIGYSGHEVGILPSVIAAQMGAGWVERHFTLDRAMYGADQAASMEPQGFARMVRDIRALDEIGGSTELQIQGDEKNPMPYYVDEDFDAYTLWKEDA